MWPFKRKLTEVETCDGTVIMNGLYTLDNDPFYPNKVRVIAIKTDPNGIPWVRYKVPFSMEYMTRKVESFLRLYKQIKD